MNQSIDISIEKLSTPIEELNLNMRSFRGLQRAGIYTVAETISAGRHKISSARNIGRSSTDHIFETVAGYLGVPQALLSSEELKQIAASQPGKRIHPLDTPVSALDLPSSTIRYLESLGVYRIRDLLKFRTHDYSHVLGLEDKDKREIDEELRSYLAADAQAQLQSLVEADSILEPSVLASRLREDLRLVLDRLEIDERTWSVLELRAMGLLPLGEISQEIGGVSKQNISNLIRRFHSKVRRKLHSLAVFWDYFEERAKDAAEGVEDRKLDRSTLALALVSGPARPNLVADEKEVEKLIVLTRTLAIHPKPWFLEYAEQRWQSFMFLCCLVDPPIKTNEKVRRILEKWRIEKKRKTSKDLAYTVLAQAGKPMHWSEIAEQVYNLSPDDSFKPRSLGGTLQYHKELFVRVGTGTYGLREWGHQPVELYTNIIASILREANRPLPFDLILAKVSASRPVKRSSLTMSLNLHLRFYRSIRNTYGLRAWLPTREERDPCTPEWLIEDPRSAKRVEREKARGYDVDGIVAQDRLP